MKHFVFSVKARDKLARYSSDFKKISEKLVISVFSEIAWLSTVVLHSLAIGVLAFCWFGESCCGKLLEAYQQSF